MSTINHLPDQEAGNTAGYSSQKPPDTAEPEAEKKKDNPAEHKVSGEIRERDEYLDRPRLFPEHAARDPIEQGEVSAGGQQSAGEAFQEQPSSPGPRGPQQVDEPRGQAERGEDQHQPRPGMEETVEAVPDAETDKD